VTLNYLLTTKFYKFRVAFPVLGIGEAISFRFGKQIALIKWQSNHDKYPPRKRHGTSLDLFFKFKGLLSFATGRARHFKFAVQMTQLLVASTSLYARLNTPKMVHVRENFLRQLTLF